MTRTTVVLDRLTRIPGVRGAMLVSREDGLVVAEAAMQGVDSAAVAALSTSLATRLERAVSAAGLQPPEVLYLEGEHGGLMAVPAEPDLLLVTVTERDANLGLLRLALRESAGAVR